LETARLRTLNSQLTKEVGFLTQQLQVSLIHPGRIDRTVPRILAADLDAMTATLDTWWANTQNVAGLLNDSNCVPLITAKLREKDIELETLRVALRKEREDHITKRQGLESVIKAHEISIQHLTSQRSGSTPLVSAMPRLQYHAQMTTWDRSEQERLRNQNEEVVQSYQDAITGLRLVCEQEKRQHEAAAQSSAKFIAGLKSELERMKVENEAVGQRVTVLEADRERWSATETDLRKNLRNVERQSQERVQTMSRAVRDQMIAVTQQCEWRIARLKEIHAREVAALAARADGRRLTDVQREV
jgi:hypothetical protein